MPAGREGRAPRPEITWRTERASQRSPRTRAPSRGFIQREQRTRTHAEDSVRGSWKLDEGTEASFKRGVRESDSLERLYRALLVS